MLLQKEWIVSRPLDQAGCVICKGDPLPVLWVTDPTRDSFSASDSEQASRQDPCEAGSAFELALQDSIMKLDVQDADALSTLNDELSAMLDVTVNFRGVWRQSGHNTPSLHCACDIIHRRLFQTFYQQACS